MSRVEWPPDDAETSVEGGVCIHCLFRGAGTISIDE
jgi:hypothetical protein